MAANRRCICCDGKYSYCPSCGSDRLKPAWYSSFCSETCKTLWETLSKYSMGFVDKNSAMEVIKSLSLKDKSDYVACVQRDMEKVLAEESKPKRIKKTEIKLPEVATAVQEVKSEAEISPIEEVAPKAAKTPVVEKTETIIAPEKAETIHEVVTETEEK